MEVEITFTAKRPNMQIKIRKDEIHPGKEEDTIVRERYEAAADVTLKGSYTAGDVLHSALVGLMARIEAERSKGK